jgi:hypothetical protein
MFEGVCNNWLSARSGDPLDRASTRNNKMKIATPLTLLLLAGCASAPKFGDEDRITFLNERIDVIAGRFNEANPTMRLVVSDAAKGDLVSGRIRAHEPEGFAHALAATRRYRVSQTAEGFFIDAGW